MLNIDKSELLYQLDSLTIKKRLEEYFGKKIELNLIPSSYEMRRCQDSGLVFAYPMAPGSPEFYQWCGANAGYYPTFRVEWNTCRKIIEQQCASSTEEYRLLDVGCGDGNFLLSLRDLKNLKAEGVDLSRDSVSKCLSQDLVAHCGDFYELYDQQILSNEGYDFITSYHCLEHVSDPLDFLRKLSILLKKDGTLFISSPLSPMSFEAEWFDVMNHPPHHLSRWSVEAYNHVASLLNLEVKYYFPDQVCFLKDAVRAYGLKTFGRMHSRSKLNIAASIIRHPVIFFTSLIHQIKRKKGLGNRLSNTILVSFTKKK